MHEVPELSRIWALVQRISAATSVVPKGCLTLDADNAIVPNRMFSGLDYPDKLESFLHKLTGPAGKPGAAHERG